MRLALAVVAAVAVLAPGAVAGSSAAVPVIVRKGATFGRILLTRGQKALYYWGVEKQARKIVCTGGCLALWPPLIVNARPAVAKKIAGVRGHVRRRQASRRALAGHLQRPRALCLRPR